jgi:molybdopterin synthase catalytic subunit
MSDVRIQSEDFDPGAEMTALEAARPGAIASLVGLVREDNGLVAMTLEHYHDFALREIGAHVAEARKRWPLLGVRVIHRMGRLTPGERIVFVGVASAHRQAAFEAAQFLMDYLKTRAPFWKLEERGARADWVEARGEDDDAVKRWR